MSQMPRSHLKELEDESIYIFREVAANFERPVLLYSVGKDSSVLVRLAQKAFYPSKIPFPLLHVDTGFKFKEMIQFRDQFTKNIGAKLFVAGNQKAKAAGTNPFDLGTQRCCSLLKTQALLQALKLHQADAAIGGARRDEEKSRAKERFFSFRDQHGQWDPKNQRPELWNIYNTKIDPQESIRVFPISNWTELDIWHYIHLENIPVVPLYFAQKRSVVVRGSQLIPVDHPQLSLPNEEITEVMCRFRTLGCSPCTGAIPSNASSVPEIIAEMMAVRSSERSTRIIDHDSASSMETKKREGYF